MQELVVEVGLRIAKLVIATVLGLVVYAVLTNLFGASGSVQLALESWLAGALAILLLESGIF
jgi:hypothetical protein